MLKFLVFLAFLVANGLWIWACTKAFGKLQSDAAEGHTFWVNQLMILLTFGASFGFIFILTGLWSGRLLAIFFIASELGILAAMLAGISLGAEPSKTYLRTTWLSIELNSKRPRIAKWVLGITVAIYLFYPIASGVVFFAHPLFSRAAQTLVVESTVLYVIFGAYPVQMFSIIPLLTSKNLDEGTRRSIFINQLFGAIPTALFAAVGFWAFSVGTSDKNLGAMSLSTWALILVFLFYALSLLVPFLLGTQLARRQRLGFLKQSGAFLSKLTGILESPTPAAYVTKLTSLHDEVSEYRTNLVNSDLGLQVKSEFDAGEPVPDSLKVLAEAMQKTGDMDPRFEFVKSLNQLENEVTEIAQDLQQRKPETIERAAAKWCRKYRARREELDKDVQSVTANKALATVLLSTAATTIVSGILSAVGKEASNVMTQYGINMK